MRRQGERGLGEGEDEEEGMRDRKGEVRTAK